MYWKHRLRFELRQPSCAPRLFPLPFVSGRSFTHQHVPELVFVDHDASTDLQCACTFVRRTSKGPRSCWATPSTSSHSINPTLNFAAEAGWWWVSIHRHERRLADPRDDVHEDPSYDRRRNSEGGAGDRTGPFASVGVRRALVGGFRGVRSAVSSHAVHCRV